MQGALGKTMKVILILGAAVWQSGPSPTMQRRCTHAIQLWKQDNAQIMVPCGGLGVHPPAEAAAMATLFLDAGIPKKQIQQEDQSKTTFENIRNAVHLMGLDHTINITIVTDRYHLPRAWMVARTFGLRPALSAPSLRGTHVPTQIKQHLREAGAIPLYAFKLLRFALSRRKNR